MKLQTYQNHIREATHPLLGCQNRIFCPHGCRHGLPVNPPSAAAATAGSGGATSATGAAAASAGTVPIATAAPLPVASASGNIPSQTPPLPVQSQSQSQSTDLLTVTDLNTSSAEASNKRLRTEEKATDSAGSTASAANGSTTGPAQPVAMSPGRIVFLGASPSIGTQPFAASTISSNSSAAAAASVATPPLPIRADSSAATAFTLLISPSVAVSSIAGAAAESDLPPAAERTILLRSQLGRHRDVCARYPIRCLFCEVLICCYLRCCRLTC